MPFPVVPPWSNTFQFPRVDSKPSSKRLTGFGAPAISTALRARSRLSRSVPDQPRLTAAWMSAASRS